MISELISCYASRNRGQSEQLWQADLDSVVSYVKHMRGTLKQALLNPQKADQNPFLTHVLKLIVQQAAKSGQALQTVLAGFLKELDDPVDMNTFREQVKVTIEKIAATKTSIVPEGQEQDFQNLVFYEQLTAALAKASGLDLTAV